ncbi:MAG: flavodoxin [Acidaminococcaceae bacterium]|nr:flavodoxin [Acidaminococcaceae bacterium]MDD4721899.1 flavodoxin [Acidaminococcaceae bacterium]
MKKIAIIFWSGTGNTEKMAREIARGIKKTGAETTIFKASEFSADTLANYDKIAFGCPSMGMEQLEDSEFEPMFAKIENKLHGKEIALFGSYGWGDCTWMREWQVRCTIAGAQVFGNEGLCVNGTPDFENLAKCYQLGEKFAS